MDDEDIPRTIIYECEKCRDYTEHEILHARIGKAGVTGTFRCMECGNVSSGTVKLPRDIRVKVLLSDMDQTEKSSTVLKENEIVFVDDEFKMDNGRTVRITHIESEDGRNRKKSPVPKIKALWVKAYDVLHLKVSINDNRKTYSRTVDADPDDEIKIGSLITFNDFDCFVHAIKTDDKLLKHGVAEAREIVRIYGKVRSKNYEIMDFGDESSPEFMDFEEEEEKDSL